MAFYLKQEEKNLLLNKIFILRKLISFPLGLSKDLCKQHAFTHFKRFNLY